MLHNHSNGIRLELTTRNTFFDYDNIRTYCSTYILFRSVLLLFSFAHNKSDRVLKTLLHCVYFCMTTCVIENTKTCTTLHYSRSISVNERYFVLVRRICDISLVVHISDYYLRATKAIYATDA